jgi:hypothetical protein
MKNGLRTRFWPEIILGIMTAALFVYTLVQRDWIENAFHVDPDQHSGALEWLIVGGLLVVTLAFFSLARYEWRRASRAIA